MTPFPVAEDFDAFNAWLVGAYTKRCQAILRGLTASIAERMQADLAAFMRLPRAPYDACDKVNTPVSSLSLVRYKNNDYSVPTRYGHQEVLAKGYVDRVEIVCRGETIASSKRPRRSIKRRLWTNGGLRRAFIGCGGSWKPGWESRDGASSSRCCG